MNPRLAPAGTELSGSGSAVLSTTPVSSEGCDCATSSTVERVKWKRGDVVHSKPRTYRARPAPTENVSPARVNPVGTKLDVPRVTPHEAAAGV